MKRLFIIVALVGAVFGAGAGVAAGAAGGGGTRVILEKLVVQDPGSDKGNQFEVDDKNAAAMFWVNMFGAQSGGEPFCTIDVTHGKPWKPTGCLGASQFGQYGSTPAVVLYDRGKRYGLTPRLIAAIPRIIAWIHSHGGRV